MKHTLTLSVLVLGMLSGCTTIYFDKGKNVQAAVTTERWHHNYGSMPFSVELDDGGGSVVRLVCVR